MSDLSRTSYYSKIKKKERFPKNQLPESGKRSGILGQYYSIVRGSTFFKNKRLAPTGFMVYF
jgi:hypothetical protein